MKAYLSLYLSVKGYECRRNFDVMKGSDCIIKWYGDYYHLEYEMDYGGVIEVKSSVRRLPLSHRISNGNQGNDQIHKGVLTSLSRVRKRL
jgi:hypothetical protein